MSQKNLFKSRKFSTLEPSGGGEEKRFKGILLSEAKGVPSLHSDSLTKVYV